MGASTLLGGGVSCPSHNLSKNGRAATSRDTGVTNRDLGASRDESRHWRDELGLGCEPRSEERPKGRASLAKPLESRCDL